MWQPPAWGTTRGSPPPDRRQPTRLWRKAAVVAAAVVFLSTLAWVSVVELPDRIDDGRAELAASECEATASVLMGYANMLVSTTRMFAQGWVGAFDEGSAGWRSVVFPASAAEAAGPRHKALAAAPHATMTSNFILSGIDHADDDGAAYLPRTVPPLRVTVHLAPLVSRADRGLWEAAWNAPVLALRRAVVRASPDAAVAAFGGDVLGYLATLPEALQTVGERGTYHTYRDGETWSFFTLFGSASAARPTQWTMFESADARPPRRPLVRPANAAAARAGAGGEALIDAAPLDDGSHACALDAPRAKNLDAGDVTMKVLDGARAVELRCQRRQRRRWIVVCRDISERYAAEREQSRVTSLEKMALFVLGVDAELNVVLWSDGARALTCLAERPKHATSVCARASATLIGYPIDGGLLSLAPPPEPVVEEKAADPDEVQLVSSSGSSNGGDGGDARLHAALVGSSYFESSRASSSYFESDHVEDLAEDAEPPPRPECAALGASVAALLRARLRPPASDGASTRWSRATAEERARSCWTELPAAAGRGPLPLRAPAARRGRVLAACEADGSLHAHVLIPSASARRRFELGPRALDLLRGAGEAAPVSLPAGCYAWAHAPGERGVRVGLGERFEAREFPAGPLGRARRARTPAAALPRPVFDLVLAYVA
ncbi:hypothetical protein JL720_6968 [Aureococcus anophagefferens]|nr:hypothetical protein JL720_6968 [Aureococcus anophagefferens]